MKLLLYLCSLVLIILLIPSVLTAQEQKQGITVSPSIQKIDLSEDIPEVTLRYTNNTKEPIVLTFKAQDFKDSDDGIKLSFLEPKEAQNYSYSLSSWLQFNTRSLTLNPSETGTITVTIDEQRLSPGGHYAAVLAQINNEAQSDDVALSGIISSLIFVRTHTGNEIEKASITSILPIQQWFLFPHQFVFRFHNEGNVEVVPHGVLNIYDPFSNLIYKQSINENSLLTLPETIRKYEIDNVFVSQALLPGFYKARLELNYGKSLESVTKELTFFSLGNQETIILIGIALTITIIIVLAFKRGINLVFLQRKKLRRKN